MRLARLSATTSTLFGKSHWLILAMLGALKIMDPPDYFRDYAVVRCYVKTGYTLSYVIDAGPNMASGINREYFPGITSSISSSLICFSASGATYHGDTAEEPKTMTFSG